MSEAKKRPEVPEGRHNQGGVTTRQMKATKTGFVGYETTYDDKQKEAEYQAPQKP